MLSYGSVLELLTPSCFSFRGSTLGCSGAEHETPFQRLDCGSPVGTAELPRCQTEFDTFQAPVTEWHSASSPLTMFILRRYPEGKGLHSYQRYLPLGLLEKYSKSSGPK